MEQAQSVMVSSEPPWVFNPDDWVYKPPAEIKTLEVASASGDLAAVQAVFELQWLEKPLAERVEIDRFASSFVTVIQNNHISVGSYLLSKGVPFNISHIILAIKQKSYAFLQLFMSHGWDINKPIGSASPPPLMWVSLYLLTRTL